MGETLGEREDRVGVHELREEQRAVHHDAGLLVTEAGARGARDRCSRLALKVRHADRAQGAARVDPHVGGLRAIGHLRRDVLDRCLWVPEDGQAEQRVRDHLVVAVEQRGEQRREGVGRAGEAEGGRGDLSVDDRAGLDLLDESLEGLLCPVADGLLEILDALAVLHLVARQDHRVPLLDRAVGSASANPMACCSVVRGV